MPGEERPCGSERKPTHAVVNSLDCLVAAAGHRLPDRTPAKDLKIRLVRGRCAKGDSKKYGSVVVAWLEQDSNPRRARRTKIRTTDDSTNDDATPSWK